MIHTTWPHAPKHFETLEDAFDYCRELDKPVRVTIDRTSQFDQGGIWKLYPSGKAEHVGQATLPEEDEMERARR